MSGADLEADAATVTDIANALRRTLADEISDRRDLIGDDPSRLSAIMGAVLALLIVEITENVDPLFRAVLIANLGGSPFGQAH